MHERERLEENYNAHLLLQRMAKRGENDESTSMGNLNLHRDVSEAISAKSKEFGVPDDVVTAIVMVESAGSRWAVRYEPTWKYFLHPRDYASRLGITDKTEEVMQATSWGCMQIMGSVARECGWQGPLVMLTDTDLGIEFGCRKLKACMQKYEFESDYIAAYNAGSPRKTPGGNYLPDIQRYVDKVYTVLRDLRKLT